MHAVSPLWTTMVAAKATALALVLVCNADAQVRTPPLANMGKVRVNTGLPHLNLGFPTQTILTPGVGEVVRLSRGFDRVPDFTYTFTHPLYAYDDPLLRVGPYGTYNSLLSPASPSSAKLRLHTPRTPAAAATKDRSASARPLIKDPVESVRFLPAPWVVASGDAKHFPKFGFYAHYFPGMPMPGLYVTGIVKDSPAHKAGLLPGDVITHVGSTPLDSLDRFQNGESQAKGNLQIGVWNAHTNRRSHLAIGGL